MPDPGHQRLDAGLLPDDHLGVLRGAVRDPGGAVRHHRPESGLQQGGHAARPSHEAGA